MQYPGIYSLGDFSIGAPETQTGEAITSLSGMLAMSIQGRFLYGSSGGTAVKLYIQTSFDQGSTYFDIACIVFGVVNKTQIINLSALTPKLTASTPGSAALADDTALDGYLGDKVRAKVVTTGTYAGTPTLSVRICAR